MMPRKSISSFISRSIVCSLMLLAATEACAQRSPHRTPKEEQEHIRMKQIDDSIPLFRGVQVKTDLVGIIQKAVSSYGQYEVGARVNLKDKYFPVIELGYGKADETNDVTGTSYKTSAPYGKIGIDFNILKNKHDIYRFYVGLRYAYTNFKIDVDHAPLTDPVWGGQSPFSAHDVKAHYHWAELTAGIDAKIVGPLHLGWSARYKRRIAHDDGELGNVWYVPGFGKQGGSRITGTFDVMLEF
ncbi:MAG: DUF6048 family protein [Prevotella sp.]|nr:DUF6048 family protein [Prevotella sp.]